MWNLSQGELKMSKEYKVYLSDTTITDMKQKFEHFLNSPYAGEWEQNITVKIRAGELGQLLNRKHPVLQTLTVDENWRYNE